MGYRGARCRRCPDRMRDGDVETVDNDDAPRAGERMQTAARRATPTAPVAGGASAASSRAARVCRDAGGRRWWRPRGDGRVFSPGAMTTRAEQCRRPCGVDRRTNTGPIGSNTPLRVGICDDDPDDRGVSSGLSLDPLREVLTCPGSSGVLAVPYWSDRHGSGAQQVGAATSQPGVAGAGTTPSLPAAKMLSCWSPPEGSSPVRLPDTTRTGAVGREKLYLSSRFVARNHSLECPFGSGIRRRDRHRTFPAPPNPHGDTSGHRPDRQNGTSGLLALFGTGAIGPGRRSCAGYRLPTIVRDTQL